MLFLTYYSTTVANCNISNPIIVKKFCNSYPRRTRAVYNHSYRFFTFTNNFERVDQSGKYHNRRTVLVIMHHRYGELLLQTFFNFKTAWRGNVLQIDTAKCRSDCLDRSHYFVDILRREHDGKTINISKTFEKYRLAFHDGKRPFGADVTESKHGRAVRNDSHAVFSSGEIICKLRVFRYGKSWSGHARCISDG